jgi:predicted dehydrogenase
MSSNVLNWRKKYSFDENYTHNKFAGGIIFDSIHEIDLNNFLFKNLKFINSFKSNFNKSIFKNSSFAIINLKVNNFCSTIQLDYKGDPDQRKLEILTDKGLIKVDIKKNYLKVYNKKKKLTFAKKFNQQKNNDYMKMIENFILCIKNKSKKPICSAIDGIKNVKIALKSNE